MLEALREISPRRKHGWLLTRKCLRVCGGTPTASITDSGLFVRQIVYNEGEKKEIGRKGDEETEIVMKELHDTEGVEYK